MTTEHPDRPQIAVIDDDAAVLASLTVVLESRFRVLTFASAEAFRAANVSETIKGAVVDVNLPGEDGVSLIGDGLRSSSDKTFILMSGRGRHEHEIPGDGRVTFLQKPFTPDAVFRAFAGIAA